MSDVPNPEPEPQPGEGPAELREAAKRGAKAEKEAANLRLENTLLKAGIDSDADDPLTKMFVQNISSSDQELTVDDVKAQALAVGVLKAPGEQEAFTPEEVEQTEVRSAIASGEAVPVGEMPEGDEGQHPVQAAYETYQADMRTGKPRDAAVAQAMNDVIGAAAGGDDRVTWDGFTEEEVRAGDSSRLNSAIGQGPEYRDGR